CCCPSITCYSTFLLTILILASIQLLFLLLLIHFLFFIFFFFNDTATTEIYTLSLHDALPISCGHARPSSFFCVDDSRNVPVTPEDRKSTRLNSSHVSISYAVFCLKKKKTT